MEIHTKTLAALEYDKILLKLADCSKLEQSKALCLNLQPFIKREDIQQALDYTSEALKILDQAIDIPIDFVMDIESLKGKNEYYIEEELFDIAKTMRTSRVVRNFLKENSVYNSNLNNLAFPLYVNKELEDKILNTFV